MKQTTVEAIEALKIEVAGCAGAVIGLTRPWMWALYLICTMLMFAFFEGQGYAVAFFYGILGGSTLAILIWIHDKADKEITSE